MNQQSEKTREIVAKFEKLSPLRQQQFYELLKLMVEAPNDVYFLVCLNSKLIYQGYSINTASKLNSNCMNKLIKRYEADATRLSHNFLCVHPDNTVFNFGLDRGVE